MVRRHRAWHSPDEVAFAALTAGLAHAREVKAIGQIDTRINYEVSGTRSMFTSTARRAAKIEPPFQAAILERDEDWGDPLVWQAMREAAKPVTFSFYLAALDRTRNADGESFRWMNTGGSIFCCSSAR